MKYRTIAFVMFLIVNPILAVGADGYRVSYNQSDVSTVISLTMNPETYKEYNVSVVDKVNTSMTIIIETFGNSGPLWGFFFINRTDYYEANHSLDVLLGYHKYGDHANYYSVEHLLNDPGNYTLAFYDTLGHPAEPTKFNATILNGLFGDPTSIANPVIFDVFYMQIAVGGLSLIAVVELYLIYRKRKAS